MLTSLRRASGLRADAAAAALGAAGALALPPLFLLPLLPLALGGLLQLIGASRTPSVAFRRGLAWGVGHHCVGLYWVTNAVLVRAAEFWWAVPLAVPLLALVLAAFIGWSAAVARLAPPGLPRILALAGAWVAGDLLRQFVLTGFPWNLLGTVAALPGLLGSYAMAPASALGVHGLTAAVILLCLLPFAGRRGMVLAASLAVLWLGWGLLRVGDGAIRSGRLAAVLVQGNVSEADRMRHGGDPAWAQAVFDRYLRLTREGVKKVGNAPFFVVWPETASPFWLEQDQAARAALAAAAAPARAILAGSARDGGEHRFYNSLIALGPDGAVLATYDKRHLVPYGEYFPSYLPIRFGDVGWTAGSGPRTLHLPGLPAIGPTICYEAIFPGQVASRADRPSLLVNITNDSWFGYSAGPLQHLAAARLRAVEEGLPLIRAANTGVSAVIDPYGRVHARLGLDREGVLASSIPDPFPPTLFSRAGLLLPIALVLTLAACVAGLSQICCSNLKIKYSLTIYSCGLYRQLSRERSSP